MKKCFFSIIIPVFNKEMYIKNTLYSVLSQSYENYEVIIINDGSTDNSVGVIEEFRKYEKIKLFNKINGGVSSARNFGINEAQHDYIAFIDADDLWSENYLFEMNNLINEHPDCGLYASGYYILGPGNKIKDKVAPPNKGVVDNYFKMVLKYRKLFVWTSAVVIPRNIFFSGFFFPEDMSAGEDMYTWIKIASHYKVCLTNKILTKYNYAGTSFKSWSRNKIDYKKSYYRLLNGMKLDDLSEVVAMLGLDQAIIQLQCGHKDAAVEMYNAYSYTKRNKSDLLRLKYLLKIPFLFIKLENLLFKIFLLVKKRIAVYDRNKK